MALLIEWEDINPDEEGHRIYISSTPMDPDNLPAPFDELGPDVTSYSAAVDETQDWYVIVSAFKGGVEKKAAEVFFAGADAGPIGSLYADGSGGMWLDFTDTSTTYQDSSGTVPADVDGHVIKHVEDKSGNANPATAVPGQSNQPVLATVGGLTCALANGSCLLLDKTLYDNLGYAETILVTQLITLDTQASTNFFQYPTSAAGSNFNHLRIGGLGVTGSQLATGGRRLASDSFQNVPTTSEIAEGVLGVAHLRNRWAEANIRFHYNGAKGADAAFQTAGLTGVDTSTEAVLFCQTGALPVTTGSSHVHAYVFEVIQLRRAFTPQEITDVYNYINNKYGLSLTFSE